MKVNSSEASRRRIFNFLEDSTHSLPKSEPESWLVMDDLFKFIHCEFKDWVPVLVFHPHLFINSVIAPRNLIQNASMKQDFLNHSDYSVSTGWRYGWSWGDAPLDLKLAESLADRRPVLDECQGLIHCIFREDYEGEIRDQYQIDQKLLHASGVFWVSERNAYCTYDQNGDFSDEIVYWKSTGSDRIICILMRPQILKPYLFSLKSNLFRLVDCHRSREDSWSFREHRRTEQIIELSDPILTLRKIDIFNENDVCEASIARGYEVLFDSIQENEVREYLEPENSSGENKEYASLIVHDWKNDKIVEICANPNAYCNYWDKSELPFSTSPAFFRPEVLSKYKNDPEKYEISSYGIRCRGAWTLRWAETNEEGQVLVYICDFRHLPINEQLYWKSFNEPPKGPISKRRFTTDFLGKFWHEEDRIHLLQELVKRFPEITYNGSKHKIWKPKEPLENIFRRINGVFTNSTEEWKNQIRDLCILIIDGFQVSSLRKLCLILGSDANKIKEFGSIGLLKEALQKLTTEKELVDQSISAFRDLQSVRSGQLHGGGKRPTEALGEHFNNQVDKINEALKNLHKLIEEISGK